MAAGLGFKTFTTGEVLTAADTNGYLMQGINVFASTAARDAAITSPQEGQFAFTKDTNGLWYYDGAAWVASGATGDIEGVTAGVGITGGGTSGTVTITNDMATTITAAGDIVVGTGSGTYDNLPIGTTAQVLTADTTVSPYKVKWATPASSGSYTLVRSGTFTTVATTTTTFDSCFTTTYKNYVIVMNIFNSVNSAEIRFQYRNGATTRTANYYGSSIMWDLNGTQSSLLTNGSTGNLAYGAAAGATMLSMSVTAVGTGSASIPCLTGTQMGLSSNRQGVFGFLNDNGAVDGFQLSTSSGTITGSVYVYGLGV
jgi:hypothetical protein